MLKPRSKKSLTWNTSYFHVVTPTLIPIYRTVMSIVDKFTIQQKKNHSFVVEISAYSVDFIGVCILLLNIEWYRSLITLIAYCTMILNLLRIPINIRLILNTDNYFIMELLSIKLLKYYYVIELQPLEWFVDV